jgi:hypothetical protein
MRFLSEECIVRERLMNIKMLQAAVAGLLLSVSGFTNAGFIPTGIQSDVEYNTVTNVWGFEEIYRDNSDCTWDASDCDFNTMFAGIQDSDIIMIGTMLDGLTFDLAAATTFESLMTHTAYNLTHEDNGVLWYNNAGALGFTQVGTTISQGTADIQPGDYRLSWHTLDINSGNGTYSNESSALLWGYRSGENYGSMERVILVQRTAVVPEPTSLAIFALGIMGLASRRFKKLS